MIDRVVVVGGSVGGIRTITGLRDGGFTGQIVLIDPDAAAPYDRPPLSKQILTRAWTPEKASLGDPKAWWSAEVITQQAIAADPAAHQVALESGERVDYDTLVIATGATPRGLPGCHFEGVHVLRTMADCLALRNSLDRGGPLVVVGGGFIGAEVASSAAAQGIPTTIVEALPAPMAGVLGDEVGALMTRLHERHGVQVRCGVGVEALEGDDRVQTVVLSDGTPLPADTVAVGIGVIPNTGWLAGSGLTIDDGVVCDEYCAATGVEDVYGIGDVARWYDVHLGRHVRLEHWTNATEQAHTVARTITAPKDRRIHDARPYFWSDQHGVKIQLVGYTDAAAEVTIVRQERAKERVAALYHSGDRVEAGLTINWPRALATVRLALGHAQPAAELITRLQESATPAEAHRGGASGGQRAL